MAQQGLPPIRRIGWFAYEPAAQQAGGDAASEEDDYTVDGPDLRIRWDEGAGPLWASDGLLPDEPEWLRRALNLSDTLVADLMSWLDQKSALYSRGKPVADWRERSVHLDALGRELAEQLQSEVGTRYQVRYQA